MKKGLYEKIIDIRTKRALEDIEYKKDRLVDKNESPKALSLAYQKEIYNKLLGMPQEERAAFVKELNSLIDIDDFEEEESMFRELLIVHEDKEAFDELEKHRPKTSLAGSTLFTGQMGPSLESELRREIRTADEIFMLVSFVKFSGLRLILDDLKKFTETKKLRVITTSYMGASDYKAILELAKLPNTEVKISYDTKRTRLHAKAYYFKRETGFSTAYIGSSNLSNPALSSGLEWNVKLSEYTSKDTMDAVIRNFDTYWNDEEFVHFEPGSEEDKLELRESLATYSSEDIGNLVFFDLKPYAHQREILEDLRTEREEYGSYRNLVVAATGTGKTLVSAFDYKDVIRNGDKKLLFLAHRKEILEQSLHSFRSVLRDHNFGEIWTGETEPREKTHLFATIQTFNAGEKYKDFAQDYFDYIVIDESHHSAANSYLSMIQYFEPEILLGLTATPERMDGLNILDYFNGRIASEIRLTDAINRKLLSPFHYFGVTDPTDLSHLDWSRGGYEISQLENVYTKNNQRLDVIISAMEKYLRDMESFKGLGFCVSIDHAEFMADSFNKAKIPSIALHSNSSKEHRNSAIRMLREGKINCIFTVDLFNEGVDIPEVDTVLFLRPTESMTVFLQQLGRGLRLSEGKEALTVLDFIGQAHRNYDFTYKFRALVGKGKRNIKEELVDEFPNMPVGCHIKLEKIAQEYILKNVQASNYNVIKLRQMMIDFKYNFDRELNLENFLDCYGLDKDEFYAKYSFYRLMFETSLIEAYRVENERELRQALRRFSRVDSRRLLYFSERILKEDIDLAQLAESEKLLLGMFHYTIWGKKPEKSYIESLEQLKRKNQNIVLELLDIIKYNKKSIKIKEINYEDASVPLDIYASYNLDQVLVAFGKSHETYEYPFREGVLYLEDHHTDIFFITINKNEEDYLPTTMYNDYAINNELFHWESQSRTSIDSPTGIRYTQDWSEKHKVLLFVRENKQENRSTTPYRFLGNASYVSHEGSSPIQIVWKMDHPIPERIIRESSLKVVN